MMRKDIESMIYSYSREERCMVNKSEMARRLNCDSRTVDCYLKIESGELISMKSKRVYESVLDDYKSIIIDKVDTYGATAMAAFKFIEKKGYKGKYISCGFRLF